MSDITCPIPGCRVAGPHQHLTGSSAMAVELSIDKKTITDLRVIDHSPLVGFPAQMAALEAKICELEAERDRLKTSEGKADYFHTWQASKSEVAALTQTVRIRDEQVDALQQRNARLKANLCEILGHDPITDAEDDSLIRSVKLTEETRRRTVEERNTLQQRIAKLVEACEAALEFGMFPNSPSVKQQLQAAIKEQ